MSSAVSALREHYRPQRIALLFVAESPPQSTGGELRFFYNPERERWDHMYRAIMKAVFPEFAYRPGEKDKWLQRFKECGFYLIDATDRPVNHLSSRERRRELDAAVQGKLSEIRGLVSPDTPIILVKKNIFSAFNRALREAGYTVIHESFLPFPSHGNQTRFIEACRNCLREADIGA